MGSFIKTTNHLVSMFDEAEQESEHGTQHAKLWDAKPEKKGHHEFWTVHMPHSPDWEPENF